MRKKALYSLYEKVEGDISMHSNRKLTRPQYVKVGTRNFPRDQAFSYYSSKLFANFKLFIRRVS